MILTSTYRDQTILSRDLLAAFSPLDHPTTATLTAQELTGAFERLMQRLAVLVALHSADAAGTFLAALADPGDEADVVDVAAAFLEHGADEAAAGERDPAGTRSLLPDRGHRPPRPPRRRWRARAAAATRFQPAAGLAEGPVAESPRYARGR
jgi:hypothetical protein